MPQQENQQTQLLSQSASATLTDLLNRSITSLNSKGMNLTAYFLKETMDRGKIEWRKYCRENDLPQKAQQYFEMEVLRHHSTVFGVWMEGRQRNTKGTHL